MHFLNDRQFIELTEEMPEIWKKASTGPYINPAEHYMYFGSRAEIESRDLPSAEFTGGFTRTAPWFPWMLMGPIAGTLVVRAQMWKSANGLDNIPLKLLSYVQKRHSRADSEE